MVEKAKPILSEVTSGVSGWSCLSLQFIHAIVAAVCLCEGTDYASSLKADTFPYLD